VRALVERQYFVTGGPAERSDVNLALAQRAFALDPKRFEAVFNLASAYARNRDYWDALEAFKSAMDKAPESHKAIALHHVGLAYHDIGRLDDALTCYQLALAHPGVMLTIHQSIAIAKLTQGKLAEGLYEFEVEHHVPPRKAISESGIPRWKRQDLTGKTIIVTHEQGFGDTIQFCRIIPHIPAAKVILSGPPMLTGLIADNIKVDAVIDESGPFEADYVTSPMAALANLGIEYPDVGGSAYLSAVPLSLPSRGKTKVGLVWRGNKSYSRDMHRSLRLDEYVPLLEIPGCAFYSLQVGEFADDIHDAGLTGFIADLTPLIKDWRDTARAIMAMDVVVTCDTATAHLAGALGKPTFILTAFAPCWRWLTDTDRSPWYGSVRLFRQHVPKDWDIPIKNVERELRKMAAWATS
jgi:hypothetical protein